MRAAWFTSAAHARQRCSLDREGASTDISNFAKKKTRKRGPLKIHANLLNASAIIVTLARRAASGKSYLGNNNRSQQSKRN
jgi:hypothetical protein